MFDLKTHYSRRSFTDILAPEIIIIREFIATFLQFSYFIYLFNPEFISLAMYDFFYHYKLGAEKGKWMQRVASFNRNGKEIISAQSEKIFR